MSKSFHHTAFFGRFTAVVALCLAATVARAGHIRVTSELAELSIEELLEVEVTLVSRTPEQLYEAPAAAYVITAEDIRRSGVTNIADALRLVPGFHVGSLDANKWAVSARGFPDLFANKLLVLVDGRSVYTPLFSGVFWDALHVPLEDIERIEAVRGPGATLWGANAVNGVVNIVTKSARDTQGGYVRTGGGTEERTILNTRYGTALGEDAWIRVYADYMERDAGGSVSDATPAHDGWNVAQTGFRTDWAAGPTDDFTVSGDYSEFEADGVYLLVPSPEAGEMIRLPATAESRAANLLGRWTHTLSPTSDFVVQSYVDYARRKDPVFNNDVTTWDVDFQHRFALFDDNGNMPRSEFIWGVGHRVMYDTSPEAGFPGSFDPNNSTNHLFSLFAQDEVELYRDLLTFTAGAKLEHNSYTEWELQPSARVLYTPSRRQTLWASVARAVRSPSRMEDALTYIRAAVDDAPQTYGPVYAALVGNRDFESEELLAWEAGYRVRPVDRISIDAAMYFNSYDNLRTIEPQEDNAYAYSDPPYVVVPLQFDNKLQGRTAGFEIVGKLQVAEPLRLEGVYTFIDMNLTEDLDSSDNDWLEKYTPRHTTSLRSSLDLPGNISCDLWYRWTSRPPNGQAGAHSSFNARVSWMPSNRLEFAVVGHDLLDAEHDEYQLPAPAPTEGTRTERGIYATVAWYYHR